MNRKITIIVNKLNFLLTFMSFIGIIFVYFFGNSLPYLNIFSSQLVSALLFFFTLCASNLFVRVRLLSLVIVVYVLLYNYFSGSGLNETYFLLLILLVRKKDLIFTHWFFESFFRICISFISSLSLPSFLFLAAGITLFSYKLIFNSYFEGDEWYWMRILHETYAAPDWFSKIFLASFHSRDMTNPHVIPISDGYQLLQFHFFGLQYSHYVVTSLLGHFINTLLVTIFTFLYCNSKKIAIAAGLLFAALTTHSQAVTWMAAVVNTQPALFFGLLSLIFSLLFVRTNKKRYFAGALFSLLCSVLSKETAIIFLALVPMLYVSEKRNEYSTSFWQYFGFASIVLAFFGVQYGARFGGAFVLESSQQPWLYILLAKFDAFDISLFIFRYLIFFAKIISQSIVPFSLISQLGYSITELQFPYFWEEESIGGTKFLVFVQSVAPEFLSYLLAFCILLLLRAVYVATEYHRQMRTLFFGFIVGVIPILLITIRFPWWGFTTAIDERHFYHLSFIIAIFLAITLETVANFFSRKTNLNRENIFLFLLGLLLVGNITLTHEKILKQQEATSSEVRAKIVSTLQKEIAEPQKKMIVYIESDSSFYGFAEPMLPFQTSFAHMLPVIFSQHMHPRGLDYPESFYTGEFLAQSKGSLVSQGVYESEDYLLGHYLSKTALLKYLHDNQEDIDSVYGFVFHSKSGDFSNITSELRSSIHDFFVQGQAYSNWQKWHFNQKHMLFKTDPQWQVEFAETVVVVKSGQRVLFEIEFFENKQQQTFAQFVGDRLHVGVPIGSEYVTSVLEMRYDETSRPLYSPKKDLNTIYTYSGNNDFFYRMSFYDARVRADVLRLLQFQDNMIDLL